MPSNNKNARTDQYIELLKIYIEQHNNLSIPYNYFIQGKNIGKWFYNIKYDYNQGKLSKYKEDKITEMGIDLKK